MYKSKFAISTTTSFFIDTIGIVVIFIVLKELQQIFIPLVIAYFLYFVFSPINKYLEKNKIPMAAAIILNLLIIIFLFGGIISIIVDSFSRFGQQLPQYEIKLNSIVSSTAISLGVEDPAFTSFNIVETLNKIDISKLAGNLFTSTFSVLGTLFFVIFFFIFVFTGHHTIYESIKRRYGKQNSAETKITAESTVEIDEINQHDKQTIIAEVEKHIETGDELQKTFQQIIDQVQGYIITKFTTSLFMGILVGIILTIAGVDFPIIWAVITFLFHFVPNIGSIIAVLLPSLMALIQFESLGFAAFLAVILILVQNIVGNIIEPKIFGVRMGLNPLIVLLSLLLWGYIWGIVGMLLSVPLTAIIKIIISRSESPTLQFINDLMSGK